ncbi:MAG: UvrB/UvrC motif-containing protein [Phycisphaerales bacterium]|nr:UvrB/UvrC motif-containing protein [Phycisphaerales bacterium]
MKCDHCDKAAVVHEVTVKNGEKSEVHLCKEHAAAAGIAVPTDQPVNQLLTQLVLSGKTRSGAKAASPTCPSCGLTFARFRQSGTLGCPGCYDAFGRQLAGLIERAQCGATHHTGKTPRRAGGSIDRQRLIHRLVRELDEAVAAEQYERAAKLRDQLTCLERDDAPGPAESAG